METDKSRDEGRLLMERKVQGQERILAEPSMDPKRSELILKNDVLPCQKGKTDSKELRKDGGQPK